MNLPKSQIKRKNENNRLRIVLAIILLLIGALIFKLYSLQVLQYDLYVALASNQHEVFSEINPERGKIFINDRKNDRDTEVYPLATNKEFALVYAIPKKIENPNETAQKLYEIFDQARLEKIVEENLNSDDYFSRLNENLTYNEEGELALTASQLKKIEEFRKVKRELEIELKRKKAIAEYEKKLSKKDDPYEPLKYKVDEEKLNKLKEAKITGIEYLMQNDRYYPQPELGAHITGFVGYAGDKKIGQYGLEGYFNEELTGLPGAVHAERTATGKLIIIDEQGYKKAEDGSDIILTIDRSIQYNTCLKLKNAVMKHGADGGSVIVMEPKTGAILAMCSFPDYDPNNYSDTDNINNYNNPAIFYQYEPGSIFKVMTMAASLDQGKVTPETTYEDKGQILIEGWPKPIKNSDFDTAGGHGRVNMVSVLENSLNTGAIFAMQKIGPDIFSDYVKKFGFGEKTGIELETESQGSIKSLLAKKIRPVEAATASFGQGITVTPLQMVNAYAVIANNGILMKPYLVKEIIKPNGEKTVTQPQEIRRVISERTSALIGGMMVKVVENGHGKRAAVKGYYIGGKTGTAQVPKKGGGYEERAHIGSFAGFGPVDDPKFVMLVKIDNPRDVEWAESSAAPLFGEIAEFILNYYQVPKER